MANNYRGNIVIPSEITSNGETYKVTALADSCFCDCSDLTSVTILSALTSLGRSIFSSCKNLKQINIPSSVTSLGAFCFGACNSLTKVTIPSSVISMGDGCFTECTSLNLIICYAKTAPTTTKLSFWDVPKKTCSLYVPYVREYKNTAPWSEFSLIYPLKEGEDPNDFTRCEKPTISFAEDKLHFSSATSGAQYHYTITSKDMTDDAVSESGTVDLAACYDISAYATANCHTTSDIATATLYWVKPEGSLTTDVINSAKMRGVVVTSENGIVSVSGLAEGESILFYSVDGKLINKQTSINGVVNFATNEKVVIVKVGTSSLKVMVK